MIIENTPARFFSPTCQMKMAQNYGVMYQMKRHYDSDVVVDLPDVMYKMKNIQSSTDNHKNCLENDGDPVSTLEKRQERILERLGVLSATLNQLKHQYGDKSSNSTSPAVTCGAEPPASLGDVIHDIVVSADPENPPVIILVMYQLLKQHFKVFASTFVHSSALHVPDNLRSMFSGQQSHQRGDHQVALTVIWKKVENGPQLMVNPHNQTTIRGEANIARYIMRLVNPHYDNTDPVTSTQIDEWVDMSQLQVLNGNKKEAAAAIKAMNSKLGRSDWLVGSAMSLADMVMWSALHQCNQASEAGGNVKKWLNACNENSYIQSAKTMMCQS